MIVYTHVVHMIISYETTHDALMIMYTHVVHMTTSYETTHLTVLWGAVGMCKS